MGFWSKFTRGITAPFTRKGRQEIGSFAKKSLTGLRDGANWLDRNVLKKAETGLDYVTDMPVIGGLAGFITEPLSSGIKAVRSGAKALDTGYRLAGGKYTHGNKQASWGELGGNLWDAGKNGLVAYGGYRTARALGGLTGIRQKLARNIAGYNLKKKAKGWGSRALQGYANPAFDIAGQALMSYAGAHPTSIAGRGISRGFKGASKELIENRMGLGPASSKAEAQMFAGEMASLANYLTRKRPRLQRRRKK